MQVQEIERESLHVYLSEYLEKLKKAANLEDNALDIGSTALKLASFEDAKFQNLIATMTLGIITTPSGPKVAAFSLGAMFFQMGFEYAQRTISNQALEEMFQRSEKKCEIKF